MQSITVWIFINTVRSIEANIFKFNLFINSFVRGESSEKMNFSPTLVVCLILISGINFSQACVRSSKLVNNSENRIKINVLFSRMDIN